MILLADSGATKAEWALIDLGVCIERFITSGINPYYLTESEIDHILDTELKPKLSDKTIKRVHFYGAGCSTYSHQHMIQKTLNDIIPKAQIFVGHDMYGAALGLFGSRKGIACILGSGSNACVYDGEQIVQNTVSLGHILGDEGSGYHLGKEFIRRCYYGDIPEYIKTNFEQEYHLNLEKILKQVYDKQKSGKFLSSLSHYIFRFKNEPAIRKMIRACFEEFIQRHVLRFEESSTQQISFIGSIAYNYQDILKQVLTENKLQLGKILQRPLDGMIEYYGNNN
ncbi:MAG: ATPase [Bacteroidales bacterium]|nr:ATPase [Bacteroidales bacterium]